MTRALGLLLCFLLPLFVGGIVLGALMGGGNEDLEGWLRAAAFTVLPAAVANTIAAWVVALRPGAKPAANALGVFLRALATFVLAVPLLFVFAALVTALFDPSDMSPGAVGAIVAMFAAVTGVVPMTLLQWLLYHFTLDRKPA